jgi:hypothetical protein
MPRDTLELVGGSAVAVARARWIGNIPADIVDQLRALQVRADCATGIVTLSADQAREAAEVIEEVTDAFNGEILGLHKQVDEAEAANETLAMEREDAHSRLKELCDAFDYLTDGALDSEKLTDQLTKLRAERRSTELAELVRHTRRELIVALGEDTK